MVDTSVMAFPKPVRPEKKSKPLKSKTRLKSHREPISTEVKEAVLEQKGPLCFSGYCPNCGGFGDISRIAQYHHFPYRSHQGQNVVEHLWACRPECHRFMHDNPLIERMMFKEIEAAGIRVVWKVEPKKAIV